MIPHKVADDGSFLNQGALSCLAHGLDFMHWSRVVVPLFAWISGMKSCQGDISQVSSFSVRSGQNQQPPADQVKEANMEIWTGRVPCAIQKGMR